MSKIFGFGLSILNPLSLKENKMSEITKEFGLIRKIAKEQTYGFLTDTNGIDRFFHWSQVSKDSTKPLHLMQPLDKVSFIPHSDAGCPQAIEVEYIYKKDKVS